MIRRIILFTLLILLASCSSPVIKLREISSNRLSTSVSYKMEYILHAAHNAAFMGERYTQMRFSEPASELKPLIEELREYDRRFSFEIIETASYTDLVVRW